MVPHGRPALRPVHVYCGAAHHDCSLHLLRRMVGPWPQGVYMCVVCEIEREREIGTGKMHDGEVEIN